jgi:cyclopropane fatty-acyl-phospholipid synthase-like methyltransferase
MGKQHKSSRGRSGPTLAQQADRHALYEAAVQCAEAEIDFVDATYHAVRGRRARLLREDFCGTANVACEWARRRPGNRAIGVDLDPEVLDWGRGHHLAALSASARRRVELRCEDVMRVATPPADLVLAMNFSYWMFRERAALRRYFRRVHAALDDDGMFFLDAFGGYEATRVMTEATEYDGFTYVWDQAEYNAVDGHYVCHIHFRFPDGSRLRRAFSYDWRFWTLPEIREVLHEAGFARATTWFQGWDAVEDEPDGVFTAAESVEPDAGWICYIVAEK